ncbi:glycoside hydrolase family 127 protein [Flavobacterium sp. Fl-77]|uniref:Glycoside hydrolase family 127 protein n=1 Tax=Flavobacterium flavipigmentatum TaxID=2893884 RepID=A0AAJ2SFB1_9FLAO|nr:MULTISPECIES: glycoside hydrolase family 127 protein [unclassified Flavobacterium]MDX6182771.1 glycoside hydrolase family 127 protein [Flavobacterium sp. Fl-33]MDX6186050.1 glycoside hydrolase family 127 protein [Flavobacterium sp. Fl-77]UFH38202.1 glycoside hydrolase family 127 protein [Flavobacterium sp. F-70]
MMKIALIKYKISYCLLGLFMGFSATAQMHSFGLNQVRLKEGPFKNAQDVDLKYILALNPDKLLAPYLIASGMPIKAERYGNWESIGLDGHIAGHYLSALAMMYASTGNTEIKNRLDYMISELAICQDKNDNGYVGGIPQGKVFWDRLHNGDIDGSTFGLNNTWVPLYNIHKLFAGLNDAYRYAHNEKAKDVLIKLGDWFIELIRPLSEEQIQNILKTEHGGINESFADLYILTKDKKYLETAEKISHLALLNPLLKKEDKLTGLHANTQIPKVIGFEKIASLSGNKEWSDAAQFFWKNVTQKRSVAFGGNSVGEHFNPTDDFSSMTRSNQGPETCNSYNMERLSKALFLDKNDISYLDFYERTLYNHILSSQHPEKGGFVYFTPIRPNHYRVYSQPETSMWCCVGSGLENHAKYGELIYSHSDNDLFVNLFIPSILQWTEKDIQMEQTTKFPFENTTDLVLKLKKSKTFSFNIRCPEWAKNFEILINNKSQQIEARPSSYVTLKRKWKSGDRITVRFKTTTRLEGLPDGSNWSAFVNGPIVLAAKTGTKDVEGLFADESRMGHTASGKYYSLDKAFALVGDQEDYIKNLKELGNMCFSLDSLELEPFFKVHDARYQMYFQNYSKEQFQEKLALLKQQEADAMMLEAKTVDKINCGEQQSEVDHLYKGEKTNSGYDDGKSWRSTRSYISYQLINKNNSGRFLDISSIEELKTDAIIILVNDKPAQTVSLENNVIRLNIDKLEVINIKITVKADLNSPKFNQLRILKL